MSESTIKQTLMQSQLEVEQAPYRAIYIFIQACLLGLVRMFALVYIPLIYQLTVSTYYSPEVYILIIAVVWIADVAWSKWGVHGDTPTVNHYLLEMMFTTQRVPLDFQKWTWTLKMHMLMTRFVYIIVCTFGTALGVFMVTDRSPTPEDTNTGKSSVWQPHIDNEFMTRNTALFMVACMSFVTSLPVVNYYLGGLNPDRLWPRFDPQTWASHSLYKTAVQAGISVFSLPLNGGFLSYEWIMATAVVTGQQGDTWILLGGLFVGTALAWLLGYLMSTFFWVRQLVYHRFPNLVSSLSDHDVEANFPSTDKKGFTPGQRISHA